MAKDLRKPYINISYYEGQDFECAICGEEKGEYLICNRSKVLMNLCSDCYLLIGKAVITDMRENADRFLEQVI